MCENTVILTTVNWLHWTELIYMATQALQVHTKIIQSEIRYTRMSASKLIVYSMSNCKYKH
jgi:hypothetical protein